MSLLERTMPYKAHREGERRGDGGRRQETWLLAAIAVMIVICASRIACTGNNPAEPLPIFVDGHCRWCASTDTKHIHVFGGYADPNPGFDGPTSYPGSMWLLIDAWEKSKEEEKQ